MRWNTAYSFRFQAAKTAAEQKKEEPKDSRKRTIEATDSPSDSPAKKIKKIDLQDGNEVAMIDDDNDLILGEGWSFITNHDVIIK